VDEVNDRVSLLMIECTLASRNLWYQCLLSGVQDFREIEKRTSQGSEWWVDGEPSKSPRNVGL